MKRTHGLMLALEALLAGFANPSTLIFARSSGTAASDRIEDLQNQLVDLSARMQNIQATADGENRKTTDQENIAIDELFNAFRDTEAEIARRERVIDVSASVGESKGRKTTPNADGTEPAGNPQRATPSATANADARPHYGTAGRTQHAAANDLGRRGFKSFGEFATSVRNAAVPGAGQRIDQRLVMDGPSVTSSENAGADGGFAVPPDFRTEIMEKVLAPESLLPRTDQLTSSSNTITIPKDETTPWQTTGGILAYWEGEAAQISQSKVALEQLTIRLNKLAALVPVTSELLEDVPALSTYLRRKAPIKIDFKITDAIVNGTGVGMPLGILNSPAKITVPKESGQAAATLVFQNIVKMYARVYSGCRTNLVWLMNQDIEPQLYGLQFPTGVSGATAVPVYLPPTGLSGMPFGTLMGRPVVMTEACQTLGTEGDIIAVDFTTYMTAMKTGGLRQDISIHLFFDYDITAFRFILRVAGQPWWTVPITPKNGSNTRGCIITLGSR